LAVADHPHHRRAQSYWHDEAGRELAFCRITSLGFLRLTTHPKAMGGEPLALSEAWCAYEAFRRLPEVAFAAEPEGCERWHRSWAQADDSSHKGWTAAYLASFARAGDFRLVSFDRDFGSFDDLEFLWLRG
jgi:toxin-antitoxin system PIN domain toxin